MQREIYHQLGYSRKIYWPRPDRELNTRMNLAGFCIIVISLIGSVPRVNSVLQTDILLSPFMLLFLLNCLQYDGSLAKPTNFLGVSCFCTSWNICLISCPFFKDVLHEYIASSCSVYILVLYLRLYNENKISKQISDPRNSFCSSSNVCKGLVRSWVCPCTSFSAY